MMPMRSTSSIASMINSRKMMPTGVPDPLKPPQSVQMHPASQQWVVGGRQLQSQLAGHGVGT